MEYTFDDPSLVYVIAEIGMTHDGSLGLARQLTKEAIAAGADIVKYQCHIADAETLKDAPSPPYFTQESRYEYFQRTAFIESQFAELVEVCHESDRLACVSTFSLESVDVVCESGVDIIKIPSGEVTNVPLLRRIAETALPVIMSTGMSDWTEIDRAVEILRNAPNFCLVQCSSIYPCPPENVGLNVIAEMAERFGLPVGVSDHTLTGATAVASIVLGARVVEKHFTISKSLYGPDARFSLEPDEFRRMVEDIRFVSQAWRHPTAKTDIGRYSEMKRIFQKSIVAKGALRAGTILTMDNLAFKKPGHGISTADIDSVLGRKINRDMNHDELLGWGNLAK